jgi:hypothetical protein
MSPVAEFPGTITLISPLNLEQGYYVSIAIEGAVSSANGDSRAKRAYANNQDCLAALIACSECWNIQGQPEKPTMETFAASPMRPASDLLAWAFRELRTIYLGELKVPNA